jgi:hypothetical protein
MKKFVVVGLFALFGGAASSTCACDENGLLRRGVEVFDGGGLLALCDKMDSILEELVEIYGTGNVKVGNPDVMDEVDKRIRDLDRMATPQEFRFAVKLYFCPNLYPNVDMEGEQKIGEEIIQRWKDLGFSRKTEKQ